MSPGYRWLIKWARTVHLYLTLFALALLLLFAVTGFMLNHEDWFVTREPTTRTVEGRISQKVLEPLDKLAVVEALRKDFGAVGAVDDFTENEDDVRVSFKRPGTQIVAEIKRDSGEGSATFSSTGLAGILVDLHRGKSTGEVWPWIIDGLCVVILFVAVTGLILWFSLRARGRYGIVVIGLGIALGLGVYFYLIP
jgi:hypothetical protein